MRVWDVHPGYLNRQSLLGEHREIHALVSIVENGKRGYANHPETRRWRPCLAALRRRHDLVVAEMSLRGYRHHSPMEGSREGPWPSVFLDEPAGQFAILGEKYAQRPGGRIVLPVTAVELCTQHSYSALARNVGSLADVVRQAPAHSFDAFAAELVCLLRIAPTRSGVDAVLLQMWDEVPRCARGQEHLPAAPSAQLSLLQHLAVTHDIGPLQQSTALSDLGVCWEC